MPTFAWLTGEARVEKGLTMKQIYENKLKILFPAEIAKMIAEGYYQRMIDGHDCHLSADDGCPCVEWTREILNLQKGGDKE